MVSGILSRLVPAHLGEYILYVLYCLLGPTAWVLFGVAMVRGRHRIWLLRRTTPLPQEHPRISILIPAKDEGERIRACIASALVQQYDNFSVIAIDDRSTDRTGAIMDEMARENPKLQVIHVPEGSLPPGWTGKCNALHSNVKHADGEWLLFVDSDVILQPNALPATLGLAIHRKLDLLSLLPRVESGGFWEGLLVPLAGMAINSLYATALTNSDHRKGNAFANGQFLLIRRSTYEAIGGHERVKDQFTEDVELARLLKSQGYRVRLAWGRDFFAVRMYSSLAGIIRGWGRNFYAVAYGKPWRTILGVLAVLLCTYPLYLVPFWGWYRALHPINRFAGDGWFAAAVLHFCVMTACLILVYAWSGNRKSYALLFPLGAAALLRVFARALVLCATGKVEWRGTNYTHRVQATSSPVV